MYEKTNWQDRVVDPSTGEVIQEGTLISAGNLNHLENGVFQNSSDISTINGNVSTINNNISSINTSVAQNTSDISTNTEDIQDLSDHIATQDAANESKFDSIDTEIENIKKRLDPEPSPEPEPMEHVIYTIAFSALGDDSYPNVSEGIYYNASATKKSAKINEDGSYNYEDWKNCFFMPKPCMLKSDGTVDYYLNPYNFEEKEDGTPSDIYNSEYNGNAVMEFPLAWFCASDTNGDTFSDNNFRKYNMSSLMINIADYKVNDKYCCYPFINENNEILKHIYISMFPANKFKKSIATNDKRIIISEDLYENFDDNDTKKTMMSWTDYIYIKYLSLMVFGNFKNTLSINTIYSEVNGIYNKLGLFSKSKQFGIQNLSNSALSGIFYYNYKFYYKLCLGTSDGTDNPKYNMSIENNNNKVKTDSLSNYVTSASSTLDKGFCNASQSIEPNILITFRNYSSSNVISSTNYTSSATDIYINNSYAYNFNSKFPLFSSQYFLGWCTSRYISDVSQFNVHFVIRPTSDSEKYNEESV